MFPLGDTTKTQVREEARARGLAMADDANCRGDCSSLPMATPRVSWPSTSVRPPAPSSTPPVKRSAPTMAPTPSPSASAAACTWIGRRTTSRPRYVLSIEPVSTTVTVGTAADLEVRDITAARPVWTGCEPMAQPSDCSVQLRAHGAVSTCAAQLDGENLTITLAGPARGMTAQARPPSSTTATRSWAAPPSPPPAPRSASNSSPSWSKVNSGGRFDSGPRWCSSS